MKKLLIICAAVFVLGVSSPAEARPDGPKVWAEVNPGIWWGFSTIQAAVDNVMDGGYIWIEDGTYTETVLINNNKSMAIDGETEAGVIVEANSAQTGDDNVFTIDANACDITIGYITIRNGDYGIRSSAGNVNILHCTLYHNGYDGTAYPEPPTLEGALDIWNNHATNGGAIRIENSAASEIAYCTIYENDRGIRYQDGDNGNIHHNVSYGNIESGIYLSSGDYCDNDSSGSPQGCTNTDVNDNESYGNMNNGILSIGGKNNTIRNNDIHDNWNSGVMLWCVGENVVQDNTIIHNNLYAFNGQGVPGDDEGGVWVESDVIYPGSSFVCKIIGNTISDNQPGGLAHKVGVHIGNVASNGIDVNDNTFTNHDIDIWVESQAATIEVHGNKLDGGDVGVQNDDTSATLDATCNWWGDATGPYHSTNPAGSGDEVSDNVSYSPWCPDDSLVDCNVHNEPVINETKNTAYYYIQDALDDADACNVICAKEAKTYEEDLVIDKANLILYSEEGASSTKIKGVANVHKNQWPLAVPNIEILADGVQITRFTIQGPDREPNKYSSGMVIGGNNVEIHHNIFQITNANSLDEVSQGIQTYRDGNAGAGDLDGLNVHDNTFEPWGTGTHGYEAIFINHTPSDPSPAGTVTIADNQIRGTLIRGITTERSNVIITGNTIETTLDPFNGSVGAFQGVNVMDYAGRDQQNVTVTNNTIEGSSGFAQGIRVGSAGAQTLSNIGVIRNTLLGNEIGVLVRSSADGVAVNYNNISDSNSNGVENTDTNNTLNAEYNWWNDYTGPSGQGPGSGDAASEYVGYYPWLTRPFCYVGRPCDYDPSPDLNGDGCVNWGDFAILASRWLEGCDE